MRKLVADQYIKGSGIEIGALCHPIETDAKVTYVDRFKRKGLHEQYPDIPIKIMNRVDVVDDGETLASFESNSQDFSDRQEFIFIGSKV